MKLSDNEKSIIKKYASNTFIEKFLSYDAVKISDNYPIDNVEKGILKSGVELEITKNFSNFRELLLNIRGIRQVFAFGEKTVKTENELNSLKERYFPIFDILEIHINQREDEDSRRNFVVWIGKDQFADHYSEKNPNDMELIKNIGKYESKVLNIISHYRFKKTFEEPDRDLNENEPPIELKNGEVYTEFLRGGELGLKNNMWDMDGLIYKSRTDRTNKNGGQFFVKGVIYEGKDLDDLKTPELQKILNAYYELDKELRNSIIYYSKS